MTLSVHGGTLPAVVARALRHPQALPSRRLATLAGLFAGYIRDRRDVASAEAETLRTLIDCWSAPVDPADGPATLVRLFAEAPTLTDQVRIVLRHLDRDGRDADRRADLIAAWDRYDRALAGARLADVARLVAARDALLLLILRARLPIRRGYSGDSDAVRLARSERSA